MSKTYKLGILGCGDFLRWQAMSLPKCERVTVHKLFDPDRSRAEHYAAQLGGSVAESEEEVFGDSDVDVVCLFVPPFLRKAMTKKAVEAGKHILATKPLAPNADEAREILDMVGDTVRCGVLYRRTGEAMVKTARELFDSGELGKLALYRQDWLHHYPEWNNWALDPEKNGGPFMDAMIHNLNIARYLMDGDATQVCFFADNLAHPDLKCTDTDLMKVDFATGGAAYLFITWAADLAVYSTEGNNREHIDLFYMITDQGWRITEETRDGQACLVASRRGEEKLFPVTGYDTPVYDRFASTLQTGGALPPDLASLSEACEDIRLLALGTATPGRTVGV